MSSNASRGVAQMEEEPNATLEVSSAKDFSVDCSGNDCNCISHKDISDVTVPICFLVKEQAKSFIEVQEVKKRLNRVENVQDDVVSAIIEIRNYLSDSKNYSALSCVATPSIPHSTGSTSIFPKQTSASKPDQSPGIKRGVGSSRGLSPKECDSIFNNEVTGGPLPGKRPQDHSPKQFELAKSKDSVLESDKQDSGLDSDCREQHDPLSLYKASLNQNNNDELLQLLDEIGHRSVLLQKQLAVAEEATTLVDLNDMPALQTSNKHSVGTQFELVSMHPLMHTEDENFPDNSPIFTPAEKKVPTVNKRQDRLTELSHSNFGCQAFRKSAVEGIDSAVVSSILKETNVVDLQRMTLTYFVDNAVLNTKLRESEQSFASKRLESDKMESALKEEVRLLMMENRELRIQLEEQRLETNAMKSRLGMLERVVQSVSNENQELNWQLSESLNLKALPKRASFPASVVRAENSSSTASRLSRRASLPATNEMNVHCVKSKLLSNNSSFLDVTIEDPREVHLPQASGVQTYEFQNGPLHSSTPMMPLQKHVFKAGGSFMPPGDDASPVNFHSVKKCLKLKPVNRVSGESLIPDTETLPLDNQFPFHTILEKLKANSEYRLSKSVSVRAGEASGLNSEGLSKSIACSKPKVPSKGNENVNRTNPSQDSQDVAQQRRKGRNIQQRIQNILDRIVAESEEAS